MFLHTAKPCAGLQPLKTHFLHAGSHDTASPVEKMMRHESRLRFVRSVFGHRATTTSNLNKWLHLAQIYLWIQISFPTLCLFIPSCVTTSVTHVWVTSEKSHGEFSAVPSCSNLVLFDDSILNGSLYILTRPNNYFFCIFPVSKNDWNSLPLTRDVAWRHDNFRNLYYLLTEVSCVVTKPHIILDTLLDSF